jgi:hypothetical protein
MVDFTIGPAHLVRFDAASPVPLAALPDDLLPDHLHLPVMGHLDVDSNAIPVWIHKASDYLDRNGTPRTLPYNHIGLSWRAWSELQKLPTALDQEAVLVIDGMELVTVAGALANDLPAGNEVHISERLALSMGFRRFRHRPACLLSTDRVCAPIRLVTRKKASNTTLRAGMLTRALFELEVGNEVQLSLIPRRRRTPFDSLSSRVRLEPTTDSIWGTSIIFLGGAIFVARVIDGLFEAILRVLLGAPAQPVRVVQGHPGDDNADRRIVRLHPAVFPVLGIAPGMQIFIHWGKERTAAVALEDYQPHSPVVPTFLGNRQTAGPRAYLPGEFPPHLVARVSLAVRYDLRMPTETVALARRRMRTLLMSQLNQLTIPVTGLLLAGLALKGIRGWIFYTGLGVVVLLGLLPLRRSSPPKGPWP